MGNGIARVMGRVWSWRAALARSQVQTAVEQPTLEDLAEKGLRRVQQLDEGAALESPHALLKIASNVANEWIDRGLAPNDAPEIIEQNHDRWRRLISATPLLRRNVLPLHAVGGLKYPAIAVRLRSRNRVVLHELTREQSRLRMQRAASMDSRHGPYRVVFVAALIGSMLALSGCFTWRCCSEGRLPGELATSVGGEQRSIALSVGSMVSLNTQSNGRMDLPPEARDVYLTEGQALFAVAHDRTRRFRVYVGNAIVIGDGAKFDVKRTTNRTDIAVVAGRVRIDAATSHDAEQKTLAGAQQQVRLAAGEATSILADGNVTAPAPIDVDDVIAWRHRRLIFRSSTLPEIAEEIGRYNRALRIRFEGDELRKRRYAAVLDADGSGLITYLKSDTSVVLERERDGFVVRTNPAAVLSEPTL